MTIVNFAVEDGRILVAVDTLGARGVLRQHINKIYPLAHAAAVVTGRGRAHLLSTVAQLCGTVSSFDDMERDIPRLISMRRIMLSLLALSRCQLNLIAFERQEIYLLGWSDRRQAFAATLIRLHRWPIGSRSYSVETDIDDSMAPGIEGDMPALHDVYAMRSAMKQQIATYKVLGPGQAVGGHMVVAEITRNKIVVENFGDIESTGQIKGKPLQ